MWKIGKQQLAEKQLSPAAKKKARKKASAQRKRQAEGNLINGYWVGPGAKLSGAVLNHADLSGLDLTGAVFDDAEMRRTKWDRAICTGATFNRTKLFGAGTRDAIDREVHFVHTAYPEREDW